MNAMETLQVRGPWAPADRTQLPDDGHRYEIIDGVLLVNAAPAPRHQRVQVLLTALLLEAAPEGLWVLVAPTDVFLAEDTVVQPDIVVAAESDFDATGLPVAPLLAVEVLSPSTQLVDRNLKRDRYERAGVQSYWVVDPEQPCLTAFELRDGRYVLAAGVRRGESWTARHPFPVTIEPSTLDR